MSNRIPSDDWDDLDKETRLGFWYGLKWALAITAAILAVCALLWALGVFSSDVKGRGDAVRTKNAAGNRIAAQEGFQQAYNDILAADRRLDTLRDAVLDDPSYTNKVTYTGAVSYCIGLVGDYNARAEKFTQEEFRDAALPKRIGADEAATDCKPTPLKEKTP